MRQSRSLPRQSVMARSLVSARAGRTFGFGGTSFESRATAAQSKTTLGEERAQEPWKRRETSCCRSEHRGDRSGKVLTQLQMSPTASRPGISAEVGLPPPPQSLEWGAPLLRIRHNRQARVSVLRKEKLEPAFCASARWAFRQLQETDSLRECDSA